MRSMLDSSSDGRLTMKRLLRSSSVSAKVRPLYAARGSRSSVLVLASVGAVETESQGIAQRILSVSVRMIHDQHSVKPKGMLSKRKARRPEGEGPTVWMRRKEKKKDAQGGRRKALAGAYPFAVPMPFPLYDSLLGKCMTLPPPLLKQCPDEDRRCSNRESRSKKCNLPPLKPRSPPVISGVIQEPSV